MSIIRQFLEVRVRLRIRDLSMTSVSSLWFESDSRREKGKENVVDAHAKEVIKPSHPRRRRTIRGEVLSSAPRFARARERIHGVGDRSAPRGSILVVARVPDARARGYEVDAVAFTVRGSCREGYSRRSLI